VIDIMMAAVMQVDCGQRERGVSMAKPASPRLTGYA